MRALVGVLAACALMFLGLAAFTLYRYHYVPDAAFREGDLQYGLKSLLGIAGGFGLIAIALALFEGKTR